MKIYKENASVELKLDEFLELLEEDALEDIIDMVIDLSETGSIRADMDGDFIYLGSINGDELSEEEVEALLAGWGSEDGEYEIMDEDEFMEFMDSLGTEEEVGQVRLLSKELILGEEHSCVKMSDEDIKVRRITNRFCRDEAPN